MSQTTIPRTPTPEALNSDDISPITSPNRSKCLLPGVMPHNATTITPPPSTQYAAINLKADYQSVLGKRERSLASPPPTLRGEPPITSGTLFGEVPTPEAVESMGEEELRRLISELLPALGEARTAAAHSKLQHSLLAIENEESVKRAEVEHEATRKEIQVLQEGSPVSCHGFSPEGSPQASCQRNLQLALAHCRKLHRDNALLEKRLRSSKRLIAQLDSENVDFGDYIQLLRKRIKDNRDHLNDLQESGAIVIATPPPSSSLASYMRGTPRNPGAGKTSKEFVGVPTTHHDPFDALLQAASLNGEANSVPSSPLHPRQKKLHQHIRGAHSLSSLPATPERRPVTADAMLVTPLDRSRQNHVSFSAPGTQLTYELGSRPGDDRESTISVSDNEDEPDQQDSPPGSQASQMASNMLRRTLEAQNEQTSPSKRPLNADKVTQGKLFGRIMKSGVSPHDNRLKQCSSVEEIDQSSRGSKKAKISQSPSAKIGLGIKSWPIPNL